MADHTNHVSEFRRLRDETRAARVNFLLTDLQAGLALLDTAAASRVAETGDRTRALAREAYDVVARHLADDTLALADDERAEIAAMHARLGDRLGGTA